MLDQGTDQRINAWLKSPYDLQTQKEILSLQKHNPQALQDAFGSHLGFGTGGIRALMGVGTARLNRYTIGMITEGLSRYILKNHAKASVVIGFDSRHHSQEFAEAAALVFSSHGISVFLLQEMRPVAYTSFVCRLYGCTAGVMITASHNPKEYNGYKVFWSDGAQVVAPHDVGIMKEIDAIESIEQVQQKERSTSLITRLDPATLDPLFLQELFALQHFPSVNQEKGHLLRITYTSLHGTGVTIVPKALSNWGFTTQHYVREQMTPDGDFPTVTFPNPEYPETLRLGIDKLLETDSDLLIANDPDADRMGVVVQHQQKPVRLNGNEMAAICVAFLCEQTHLPQRGAFVTTIVTTPLLKAIAAAHSVACFEVLTGFKYVGEKIHLWETTPNGYTFIFGSEESCGCLLGTYARDKDASIGACLIAEIALFAKLQGKTLIDMLEGIYQKYGIFQDELLSLDFPVGLEGMLAMQKLMDILRKTPPKTLCQLQVLKMTDYLATSVGGLPLSDVLRFELEEKITLTIRPSGTEPKIKIYGAIQTAASSPITPSIEAAKNRLHTLLQKLKQELLPC